MPDICDSISNKTVLVLPVHSTYADGSTSSLGAGYLVTILATPLLVARALSTSAAFPRTHVHLFCTTFKFSKGPSPSLTANCGHTMEVVSCHVESAALKKAFKIGLLLKGLQEIILSCCHATRKHGLPYL